MLKDFFPQILLPFVEIILSGESLSIAASHLVNPVTTERLKAFIEDFTHLVVLLVASVTKAKDCEVHASEWFSSFVLLQTLQPLEEVASIVARVSLVMSGNANNDERLLCKLVLLKVHKIDDLEVLDAKRLGLLFEHTR